jgi:hypothetical protein
MLLLVSPVDQLILPPMQPLAVSVTAVGLSTEIVGDI